MEHARPAHAGDTARLVELVEEAVSEISDRRGGAEVTRDVLRGRSVPAAVAEALQDPLSLVVTGELHGAILGVGAVRVHPGAVSASAAIDLLYVDAAARGVGLGEAIMDVMAEWAARQACATIEAVALPGSREAKAFFETHGMVTRALIMQRRLDPAG